MQFGYCDSDFILTTEPWNASKPRLSKFDREVQTRWEQAVTDGHFRYTLDEVQRQIIKGNKHYVADLNVKRAQERRKPQPVKMVNEPFKPELFNFNKIKPEEILLSMQYHASSEDHTSKQLKNGCNNETDQKERNLVVINVSPLGYGHVLIVPDIEACYPQVLTEKAVRLALDSILLSAHRGFRLGFNSMCAFASVNHLHLHAYYLDVELYVEYCEVEEFIDICYELTCTPVRGFAVQLNANSISRVTKMIHLITSYMSQQNIAHNLFITRGTEFGKGRDSPERTVRVFIWPRKVALDDNTGAFFNVAAVELAGHFPIREAEGFWDLTEEFVEKTLSDTNIPLEEFTKLKRNLRDVIENQL